MFEGSPEYKEFRSEIDPLINGFFSLGKMNRKYIQFKKSLDYWNKRFAKSMKTVGTVESLQKLAIPIMMKEKTVDDRRLITVIGLFRYLGLVESIGAQLVDLTVLLLVANGYEFHVEQKHKVPRVVHATSLKDLRNPSLGVKIKFLEERCNLKKTAKIIDKDLRNSIAHLNFEVNENGTVSARSQREEKKEIDIYQKIRDFIRKSLMLLNIFNEIRERELSPDKRLLVRKTVRPDVTDERALTTGL